LFTTNLVVAEVHRLLLFRAGPRVASAVLERIDGSDLVAVDFATAAHHAAARGWLSRLGDQTITYTDAVSFAVMQSRRCRTAFGFDHHFVSAGFTLWQA
jgi:predicted nucleic acid-binding protein